MKRCWDSDPYKHPFARELRDIIKQPKINSNKKENYRIILHICKS